MKQKPYYLLVLVIVLFSCQTPGTLTPSPLPTKTTSPIGRPLPTVTLVCISPQPTQRDVDRVLSYANKVIDHSKWERSYTISQNRVAVIWSNAPLGAVIYLEALIFPCQYEEVDLDNYFNDSNWNKIFLNYENHDLITGCSTGDGLRLYQFKASNQGLDYNIQYYVESDSDTRVITTMLVFPVRTESLLKVYSSRLFPNLKTCS